MNVAGVNAGNRKADIRKGEKMKKIIAIIALVAVCAVCLNEFGLFAGRDGCRRDTLRVTVYDTVVYYKPETKDSTVVRYVTERLLIADNVAKLPETGEKSQDSVPKSGKTVGDSANVVIPITQKVYEDSMYKAYVSGYRASLDSFYIYPRKEVITIREKPRRWHIGISAGYGLTPKGFQPYIGIGVTYSLMSF